MRFVPGSGFSGIVVLAALTGWFGVAAPAAAQVVVPIDQGWKEKQLSAWYSLSQGSRLIPLDWLLALEQSDSQKKFLDRDNIEKFGYLPAADGAAIPLPVGFVTDEQSDWFFKRTNLRWKPNQNGARIKWVGMNCAACHTAEISFRDERTSVMKKVLIAGGPTLADFQTFMIELNEALRETRKDTEKFKRFAAALGASEDSDNLGEALKQLIDWQDTVEDANKTTVSYGFGRLDAFGHIYNKVAIAAQPDKDARIRHPSNAPVSYPFLWNIPQHNRVQWNGIAKKIPLGNFDVGALARNVGEVTGVFAETTWFVPERSSESVVKADPSIKSSAKVNELKQLEKLLESLKPPMWPTGSLGAIDDKLHDRGRELFIYKGRKFADGRPIPACNECHRGLGRNDLESKINACMIGLKEIGTDPGMARNAVNHKASTGVLLDSSKTPLGAKYPDTAPISTVLTTTVADTILGRIGSVARGVWDSYGEVKGFKPKPKKLPSPCLKDEEQLLAYKARPLTGIWATAPYLHNGSVPTLYDLLLPADKRPAEFVVGTREFDTKRVGFVTRDKDGNLLTTADGARSFVFRTRNAAGQPLVGNSNAGHDYGNDLFTDDERWALVEYMKRL